MYTLAVTSSNAWNAHMSANTFARLIGDRLKSSYPAKVLDPSVHLRVFRDKDGARRYRLIWSCRIVPVSKGETPDWYFDRRGAMMSGKTPDEALAKADAEIKHSGKIANMRKRLPRGTIPPTFVRTSFSGSSEEGYWAIIEIFIVAPKQR
jgi:hypothetical protein